MYRPNGVNLVKNAIQEWKRGSPALKQRNNVRKRRRWRRKSIKRSLHEHGREKLKDVYISN